MEQFKGYQRILVRGTVAWIIILIMYAIISIAYHQLHELVQFLPTFTLSWVPGIDLIWVLILIHLMGTALDCINHEECILNLCNYCKYCTKSKWICCYTSKIKVAVPIQQAYVLGSVISSIEKNGKLWYLVAYGPCMLRTKALFLQEDVMIMNDAEHNQDQNNDKANVDE